RPQDPHRRHRLSRVAKPKRMLDHRGGFLDAVDVVADARFAEDEQRRAVLAGQDDDVNAINVKAVILGSQEPVKFPHLGTHKVARVASMVKGSPTTETTYG